MPNIQVRQEIGTGVVSGGTSTAITFGSNVLAGSTIYIATQFSDAANSITSITGGGTWGAALDTDVGPFGSDSIVLAHYEIHNVAGGAVTVTVNYTNTLVEATLYGWEIINAKPTAPIDGHAINVQTAPTTATDAVTSGSVSNSNQPALVVSLGVDSHSIAGGSTGGNLVRGTGEPNGSDGIWGTNGATVNKRVTATGGNTTTYTAAFNETSAVFLAIFDEILQPIINTGPVSQTVYERQTATFTVSATTSGGTLHYQWVKNGSNVGTDSSSYTTGTLTITDNVSIVYCVVTDSNGTTNTDTVSLRVLEAPSLAWIHC